MTTFDGASARPTPALDWHESHTEQLTPGERAADRMRNVMGSWPFVGGFELFMALWALINAAMDGWDPYPFILLNLFLSMLAGLQGAILLIAARRQDAVAAALAGPRPPSTTLRHGGWRRLTQRDHSYRALSVSPAESAGDSANGARVKKGAFHDLHAVDKHAAAIRRSMRSLRLAPRADVVAIRWIREAMHREAEQEVGCALRRSEGVRAPRGSRLPSPRVCGLCLIVDREWMKPLTEFVHSAFALILSIEVWQAFPFDLPVGSFDWVIVRAVQNSDLSV